MKYKVGDKVRIRRDLQRDKKYAGCYFNPSMAKYCGKVVTIDYVFRDTGYFSCKESSGWQWSDEMVEKVDEMGKTGIVIDIVIDGKETRAKYGNKVGVAKCSPDDEFDIFVGAKLALERLEEKCKPYGWLKNDECYYSPSPIASGFYERYLYKGDTLDKRMLARGLVFETKEEAIEAAKKMLAVVKEGDSND